MRLKVNTIIHLEDDEMFVLLSETEYCGSRYFLAMGVDEQKDVIPHKVAILEEIAEDDDIYVDRVTDPDLVVILTGILKRAL